MRLSCNRIPGFNKNGTLDMRYKINRKWNKLRNQKKNNLLIKKLNETKILFYFFKYIYNKKKLNQNFKISLFHY
jgi:hypothetical protein